MVQRSNHVQIHGQSLQRSVRVGKFTGNTVTLGTGSGWPECVNMDVSTRTQFADEFLDMYASATIDIWWPLPGQYSYAQHRRKTRRNG